MLSKSQARLFFLGGTVLFSCLFLFLTIDSVRQIPAQTNAQNITPAVLAGKVIWEENNCMGCHTILGEGAYYAPELTQSYTRRNEAWLKLFLKDPQAMYPNDRKMVQYDFSDEDIDNVIAFLKWISEMDLNGFPAEPSIKFTTPATDIDEVANNDYPAVYNQLCSACHSLGGEGGNIGPALDGVSLTYEAEYLRKWITDPPAVKPGTTMPKLPLTDSQIDELVTFLSTL